MKKSQLLGTLCAALCTLTAFSAQAALVDNGMFTTDTATQLDWLDLTETADESYDTVAGRIAPAGDLFGWSFATESQVIGLFDSAGGTGPYPQTGPSAVAPATLLLGLWGTLLINTEFNVQQSHFLTEPPPSVGTHNNGFIEAFPGEGGLYSFISIARDDTPETFRGSALIRPSAVPIPAAVWLFGTGLVGLVGVARRKARA